MEGEGPGVGQHADEEKEKEEEEETSSRSLLSWPRSLSTTAVVCPWLVLLSWCFSRCIPFVCRQDSAARQHGRYGPELQYSRRRFRQASFLALCSFTLSSGPRCSASWPVLDRCLEEYRKIGFYSEMTSYVSVFCSLVRQWIHIYVSLQRPGLWFRTPENCGKSAVAVHRWSSIFLSWCRGQFPWFCFSADHGASTVAVLVRGDRRPCCAGRAGSLPCRDAEADSHGLACLVDHRDFTVAVRAGLSMSLLCTSSWIPGAVVKETVEISQLLLLRNRWLPVVLAALRGGVGTKVFFRALYTDTGPGVVSTGTRPP